MKTTILVTALLVTAFNVNAEITNEKWDCYKGGDKLITLDFKHNTGQKFMYTSMRITGILKKSKSYLDGINRRWDGISNDANWSFLISPDGSGMYYRFLGKNEKASPSEFFTCKIREAEVETKPEVELKPNDIDYWNDEDT